ncbi:hypothetical protein RND81_09G255700 [Saponaria officinalis]|uniref:J domain-containing protein n=1 Tax=Saponaria officinalis TaxID=3572 RepID=A0AAW1ISK3_SAPOF
MNPYGASGFQNSSNISTNFEFSAPGTSKLGGENHVFNSSSGLSKPRMAKSRKSLNSKSKGSSETWKNDPGYNPFRPVSVDVVGVSSDESSGVSVDVNGVSANRNSRHLKLKVTNKVEKVGNELIDEIRKLRIANQSSISGESDKNGVDVGLSSKLSQDLKRMNLGSSSVGSNVSGGVNSSVSGLGAELPSNLSRLNLRDGGEVGGSSFEFGRSRANVDSVVDSILPENIKKLNLEDHEKRNATKKDTNVDTRNRAFVPGSIGVMDTMVFGEMEKLNIRGTSEGSTVNAPMNESTSVRKSTCGGVDKEDVRKSDFSENVSSGGKQDEHSSTSEAPEYNKSSGVSGIPAASKPSFPFGGFHYQVPYSDKTEKMEGFSFTVKQESTRMPNIEFKTPEPKGSLFSGSNTNMGFRSKKGTAKVSTSRGRKAKVKEPNPVLLSMTNIISPMETSMQHEPSDSYSPMDVSPCREIQDDAQSGGELSMTSTDAVDEQLVSATERMDINDGNDLKHGEENMHGSHFGVNSDVDRTTSVADCVSSVVDVSFKSAAEDLDDDGQSEVQSKNEVEDNNRSQYFSASSSISSGGSSFEFAASSSSHGQASATTRHQRKKNRMKPTPDISIPPRIDSLSDATSSLRFSPISEIPVLSSHVGQNDSVFTAPFKSGISRNIASPTKTAGFHSLEETKKGIASPTPAARAAQEACEKWRLRGNQAYANGDLKKAEDFYTQGLSCIPRHETSRDCLRSLVLCYSNRAAARMSTGRMSEALQDCLVAAEIDPNFFRVQLRAANCYLALGKIGNASRYFKQLLQSTDVCVERKIILEASDGLQKAQKVSECMDRSTLFLQQRTLPDAENALEIIAEALVISPYSEQLLESKAGALFMLRRYEEVIQLCEETLEAAEKNYSIPSDNELSSNVDAELLEKYSFCTWRFGFIFKSNFYLGKLEEALELLEKQEKWSSMVAKCGNETLESLLPQHSTVRELIRHKSAGNGAFQTGRHAEAVEHYSAALSFNVESRPFAAVCFGNRAAAYQALGQITEAVADCSLAIALDGNYLKAISRRATLFEMIRDYDQAAKDLEKLVSLLTKQAEEKANPSMNLLADLKQARQRLYQMEDQAKRGIPLNFYLILGVEPSVAATDLKKAYRKAALRHHPDKAGQSLTRSECGDDGLWKEVADEVYKDTDKLFKMIGEAYAVLSDPTKRSQYDIEEEMRNGVKKHGNTSRMPNDANIYTEERSGGIGRQWREGWRTSANPYSRGFEPTRPSRYY